MMTPTNHTTLTPEGMERKLQRLIARALKKENPYLYARLEAEAMEVIEFDQQNPFATVTGTSRRRPTMKRAIAAKLIKQEAAIEAKFYPIRRPGVTAMMVSTEETVNV